MNYFVRRPWDLPQRFLTPEDVYRQRKLHRREFLTWLGLATGVAGLSVGCSDSGGDKTSSQSSVPLPLAVPESVPSIYPATRNPNFKDYGRAETEPEDAARYTNFYEFSTSKSTYKFVSNFKPSPWAIEIGGLCDKPGKFDLDDLYKQMSFEERACRLRCVETWAMCVPWTGFPLRDLLKLVEPKAGAKYVSFTTFDRPDEATNMARTRGDFPWPYTEGLTIAEATNELAFIATGIYGKPLPKQHGAPIRLVLPWKYGFKSIKSIVQITLTDKPPATFWNTVNPAEYDFEANVNPTISHPRWSQRTEWMLGTRERHDTVIYNGYGEYVASMYKS